MSKRKREDDADGDRNTKSSDFRQQRRIVAAFTQSALQLSRAFKTARGFERQKLGRRKKNAVQSKDETESERIDGEVAALKNLDLMAAAQYYLSKSLLKFKAVATHPDLPNELSKPSRFTNDPATLNVHARLCNSNPVKAAYPKLFNDIKREFGMEVDAVVPAKKKRLRKKDFEDEDISSEPLERPSKAQSKKAKAGELPDADSEDDDNWAQYEGRLASSDDEVDGLAGAENSEDDSDVEVSDLEDLERQLAAEGLGRKTAKLSRYDHATDLSLSEESPEKSENEQPKKAVSAPKKSSFIPSLTLGGYISGSGSDIEDEIDVAPKKNRRGQRARQQIWEAKYGAKAKHLQNQKPDRSGGWDPKRGAVSGNTKDRNQRRFGKGANAMELGNNHRLGNGDGGASQSKTAKKDDSGPLHPSWEAAKRAKEKKSAPVAFQGKKISFD